MNEQGMLMRGDAESSGRKARGPRLRALIMLATPPSPATKLLFVLLVMVVTMWIVSHSAAWTLEFYSDGFVKGSYFVQQRDGILYIAVERGMVYGRGVNINEWFTPMMMLLVVPHECADHALPGVDVQTGGVNATIAHVHHWLIATLIALPLAILWLRQVVRRGRVRNPEMRTTMAMVLLVSFGCAETYPPTMLVEGHPARPWRCDGDPASTEGFITWYSAADLDRIVRQYVRREKIDFSFRGAQAQFWIAQNRDYMAKGSYSSGLGKPVLSVQIGSDGCVQEHSIRVAVCGTGLGLAAQDLAFRERLEKPMPWHFDETPFDVMISEVSKAINIPIHVNWEAMERAWIDPETPVTLRVSSVNAVQFFQVLFGMASEADNIELYVMDGELWLTERRDGLGPGLIWGLPKPEHE